MLVDSDVHLHLLLRHNFVAFVVTAMKGTVVKLAADFSSMDILKSELVTAMDMICLCHSKCSISEKILSQRMAMLKSLSGSIPIPRV